jgi:uncharacterized protein
MDRVDGAGVAEALARVLPDVPGVVSAYLFGSLAAARAHRQSDVDVAVLLQRGVHATAAARFDVRLRLMAAAAAALRRNDIDLVVLNEAPPHLAREIVTRGRRIYLCDPVADHAFRRTAMLRAADLEPFLRRTRQIKLAWLKA